MYSENVSDLRADAQRRLTEDPPKKKKTHEEILAETRKRFTETEVFLEKLRAKNKLIEEQIENLERKQQNRQKFLSSSTTEDSEES